VTHVALYVKDKFSISNRAFHEMSMITPGLTTSSKIQKLQQSMNDSFDIRPCPNAVIGMQQSLQVQITQHVSYMFKEGIEIPRIKLTGDGTRIARGLNVVNMAFTIIEEGANPHSDEGNHTIAIIKVSETYDELLKGLQDIREEARDLEVITIGQTIYRIIFF